MAESNFVFIWDKENQVWVAGTSTKDRRRKTQNLPIDADLIPGARRVVKGDREILYIPKSKKEELYKAFPDFQPQKDIVRKGVKKGAEVVREGAEAVVEPIERVSPDIAPAIKETAEIKPASLSIGESIGKSFKSKEVEPGSPLPGSTRTELKADTTVAPTATVSGYGAPLTTQGRSVPVVKYIDNVADLANIEPSSVAGIFRSDIGEETIFLPSVGKQVSSGITLNQFTNNIWGLSPAAVVEYKKAIGYKDQTGVVTSDFADTLIKRVLPVSEANYRNAMNNKPSASWEELVINPAKYTQYVGSSLAGGGAGVGPSAQEIKVKADAIRIYATDLGVGLDDGAVNKLAREWAAGNFDTTTIKPQIARSGKIDFAKGAAAEQLNSLKELAGSFGMQYDEGWYNTAATNVLTGKDDIETYKQYVKDQAKSKFPTLSAQLDQGFTVRQLASPYIQTMSNILEIDPNTIGLNDIYVNQALTGLNDKGEPSTKPLWQFEQDLRKDPRWNYTKNAQDSLMGTARKVLQDFGLVS